VSRWGKSEEGGGNSACSVKNDLTLDLKGPRGGGSEDEEEEEEEEEEAGKVRKL
jgi:hypothetical protein